MLPPAPRGLSSLRTVISFALAAVLLASSQRASARPVESEEPLESSEQDYVAPKPRPTPWSAWIGIGGGKAWGGAISTLGIEGPTWAFGLSLGGSYRFLYAGAGFSLMQFHDTQPLEQDVVEVLGNREIKIKASGSAGGGYVEAGLAYRFFIKMAQWEKTGEAMGLALHPAVGYGMQWIDTISREIGNCVGCDSQIVADYHGGQFVRFQLGLHVAGCSDRACGFLGVSPSYQYFWREEVPGLTGYLDITLHIGFGMADFRSD